MQEEIRDLNGVTIIYGLIMGADCVPAAPQETMLSAFTLLAVISRNRTLSCTIETSWIHTTISINTICHVYVYIHTKCGYGLH